MLVRSMLPKLLLTKGESNEDVTWNSIEQRLLEFCRNNSDNNPETTKRNQAAIGWLVRTLKTNPDAINELGKAISRQCSATKCVLMPNSYENRLLVSHRRGSPHVVFCCMWRWPDLQSKHQLKTISNCTSAKSAKSKRELYPQTICINPYHYERKKPERLEPILFPTHRIAPDLSTSFEDSNSAGYRGVQDKDKPPLPATNAGATVRALLLSPDSVILANARPFNPQPSTSSTLAEAQLSPLVTSGLARPPPLLGIDSGQPKFSYIMGQRPRKHKQRQQEQKQKQSWRQAQVQACQQPQPQPHITPPHLPQPQPQPQPHITPPHLPQPHAHPRHAHLEAHAYQLQQQNQPPPLPPRPPYQERYPSTSSTSSPQTQEDLISWTPRKDQQPVRQQASEDDSFDTLFNRSHDSPLNLDEIFSAPGQPCVVSNPEQDAQLEQHQTQRERTPTNQIQFSQGQQQQGQPSQERLNMRQLYQEQQSDQDISSDEKMQLLTDQSPSPSPSHSIMLNEYVEDTQSEVELRAQTTQSYHEQLEQGEISQFREPAYVQPKRQKRDSPSSLIEQQICRFGKLSQPSKSERQQHVRTSLQELPTAQMQKMKLGSKSLHSSHHQTLKGSKSNFLDFGDIAQPVSYNFEQGEPFEFEINAADSDCSPPATLAHLDRSRLAQQAGQLPQADLYSPPISSQQAGPSSSHGATRPSVAPVLMTATPRPRTQVRQRRRPQSQQSDQIPEFRLGEPVMASSPHPLTYRPGPGSVASSKRSCVLVGVQEVPCIELERWCTVSYLERGARFGEPFIPRSYVVTIDGSSAMSLSSHWCLGSIKDVRMDRFTTFIRRRIGKGLKLTYVDGDVYVENLDVESLFISSPVLSWVEGSWPVVEKVIKIFPRASIKVFSMAQYSRILAKGVIMGYKYVQFLQSFCTVRVSFVKGWGSGYKRIDFSETPCGLLIELNVPSDWVSKILYAMRALRLDDTETDRD